MPHKSVRIFGDKLAAIIDGDPLLTNAKIAKALGVTRETVSRWKNAGIVGVNAEAFDDLAAYLKREPRQLLEDIGADDASVLSATARALDEITRLISSGDLKTGDVIATAQRAAASSSAKVQAKDEEKRKKRGG